MAEVILRGKTFPARERPSEWLLMKLADAHLGASMQKSMAATYRFLRHVLADSWVEFEAYVDELVEDPASDAALRDDFDEMIGDYLASITDRPTQTSSVSPGSEPSTSDTSKVASISQGSPRRASLSKGWIEPEQGTGGSPSDAAAG